MKNVFLTTRQVELIGKKEFAAAAFDLKYKAFVVHKAVFSVDLSDEVHPSKKGSNSHLKVDKAVSKVPSKYVDFGDVFSPKLAVDLPKYTEINNHVIELENN